MSAGLSRSIRNMRPVDSASTSTLLATAAATKSDATENCSDTRSMLNMGSAASPSWKLLVPGAAYPLDTSYAMLGFPYYVAIFGHLSYCAARFSFWGSLRGDLIRGAGEDVGLNAPDGGGPVTPKLGELERGDGSEIFDISVIPRLWGSPTRRFIHSGAACFTETSIFFFRDRGYSHLWRTLFTIPGQYRTKYYTGLPIRHLENAGIRTSICTYPST